MQFSVQFSVLSRFHDVVKFCGSEVTSKKEWDVWSSLSLSGLELKHSKMPSHKAEFALTHVSEQLGNC